MSVLVLALTPGAARAADPPGGDGKLKVEPISYVVLVDESGSLKGPDLDREKDAAGLAAVGELSPDSRVGVVGFGSGVNPKSPVDVVCPMTAVSDPAVTRCAGGLRARTDQEGNNTDIPAAIKQGVSMLRTAPAGQAKVLFITTDGAMSVQPGEGYGNDAARIPGELDKGLSTALAEAKAAGVQIWPLGFGNAIDRAQLDRIASGGAPSGCSERPEDAPKALVVKDSTEVVPTLRKAFAAARCAVVTQVDSTETNGEADLNVTIPAIATDVVIQVQKTDERIETTFFDPEGRRADTAPDTERRGMGSRIETLRIADPVAGKWRIHLKASAGVSGLVSTAAVWQGVVKSYVQLNPPQPSVGESVRFSVFLQTRARNLTDPAALKGVVVSGRIEGSGINEDIPLKAGDKGEYYTDYRIPGGSSGDIKFTGTVTAPGLAGTREAKTVALNQGPAAVGVELKWGDTTIEPGGSVAGTVQWKVTDGKPHTLRVVADFPPNVGMRITGGEQRVSAGSDSFGFKLAFGDGIAKGDHTGRVRVVDTSDGDKVLADTTRTITVEPPPGFWDRYLWLVIGAVVLIALLLGLLGYLAKRRGRARRIGPIVLRLYRDGQQVGVETRPLDERAEAMWFKLDTTAFPPQLIPLYQHEPGTAWTVRRTAATGTLDVETPLGTRLQLDMGRPTEIEPGLALGFADERVQAGPADGVGGSTDPYGGGGGSTDPYGGYGSAAPTAAPPRPYGGEGAYGAERPYNPYGPYGSGPAAEPGSGPGANPGPDDTTFGYGPPR